MRIKTTINSLKNDSCRSYLGLYKNLFQVPPPHCQVEFGNNLGLPETGIWRALKLSTFPDNSKWIRWWIASIFQASPSISVRGVDCGGGHKLHIYLFIWLFVWTNPVFAWFSFNRQFLPCRRRPRPPDCLNWIICWLTTEPTKWSFQRTSDRWTLNHSMGRRRGKILGTRSKSRLLLAKTLQVGLFHFPVIQSLPCLRPVTRPQSARQLVMAEESKTEHNGEINFISMKY